VRRCWADRLGQILRSLRALGRNLRPPRPVLSVTEAIGLVFRGGRVQPWFGCLRIERAGATCRRL